MRLARKGRLLGTFVKLAAPDVVELASAADLDFVVADLEHSTLSEGEAIGLIRHGSVCGIPVLVRVPAVDPGLICRLLENGAAGIQLSTLRSVEQARQLHAASRFAPSGARSVSLANRAAGFGAIPLAEFLAAEEADPPFLVGQIETPVAEPLAEVVAGLDVAFVGTTDLAVSLGMPGAEELAAAVDGVRAAAGAAGVAFGGWSADATTLGALGLGTASYVVVGSDLQLLAQGLRAVVPKE